MVDLSQDCFETWQADGLVGRLRNIEDLWEHDAVCVDKVGVRTVDGQRVLRASAVMISRRRRRRVIVIGSVVGNDDGRHLPRRLHLHCLELLNLMLAHTVP